MHSVHHAPVRVNASNNLTTHPINVLRNPFARTVPWLLFGFDAQVIAWAALFIQVQCFAVHANVAGTIGWLNRWIGSAELHRWHHSVVLGEALNFGTALPLWDRVFGSYKAPSVYGPVRVGLTGQAVRTGWRLWRKMLLAPLCQRRAV